MSSWILRGYDSSTERIGREYPLALDDPQMLRQSLRRPGDDPLFDFFPVPRLTLESLVRQYGLPSLEDDLYYFVEYLRTDDVSEGSAPP